MSKPEWKVTYINGNVEIRSNNFTHDAVLYLTGDFATHEVAISYASKLVAKLNADLSHIEAETEARVLEKAIVACKGVNENRKAEHLVCVSDTVTQCVDAIRALSFQCADGGHCGDGGYCDECPHRNTNEKQVEGYVPPICSTHGVQYTPTKMPIGLVYSCPKCMIQASPDTDVSTPTELVDEPGPVMTTADVEELARRKHAADQGLLPEYMAAQKAAEDVSTKGGLIDRGQLRAYRDIIQAAEKGE